MGFVADSTDPERCCVILDASGKRCAGLARYWVGCNGVDDYTHVCDNHVEDVLCEGDIMLNLKDAY